MTNIFLSLKEELRSREKNQLGVDSKTLEFTSVIYHVPLTDIYLDTNII